MAIQKAVDSVLGFCSKCEPKCRILFRVFKRTDYMQQSVLIGYGCGMNGLVWRIGAGFAVLAAAIGVCLVQVDQPVALAFAAMKTTQPELIGLFQTVTTLGKSHWYLVPLGVYGLVCAAAWRWGATARRPVWQRRCLLELFVFANIAVSGLLVDGLKILVGRPRPVLLLEQGIFNQFMPLALASRWWSFPSGHTATIVSLALAVGALWPRWRWPLLVIAGVAAASRVIITAHYLADILAGIGMAVLVFMALQALFLRRGWLPDRLGERVASRP
jgi:membrane-associated phospholipid phosphatase